MKTVPKDPKTVAAYAYIGCRTGTTDYVLSANLENINDADAKALIGKTPTCTPAAAPAETILYWVQND